MRRKGSGDAGVGGEEFLISHGPSPNSTECQGVEKILALSIKARIPVIRAHTSDLLNFPDVLCTLAPGEKIEYVSGRFLPSQRSATLWYATEEITVTRSMYDDLMESGRVLLLINQEPSPYAFDAGEVPVPKKLMVNLLDQAAGAKADLLPCFDGLTLKQAAEAIKLTQARDKSLTRPGIMQTRALFVGRLQGLEQVETGMPFYLCPPQLRRWIDHNLPYFNEGKDQRLVPRGILLDGEAGTGKTAGAKFIARELGVPLYRLDLGAALSKWVSESEQQLSRILSTLDQEAPACLLIDETEKLFAETEDQGITSRLLSQLLWWMSERRSRILTVMTTNNRNRLPKELYRAGRIDTVMTLPLLDTVEACDFAREVLAQFVVTDEKLHRRIAARLPKQKKITHASVIQSVIDFVKENRLTI